MSNKVPNFIDYQVGKEEPADKTITSIAQDQDTVIGDAMCHAAQILYDVANQIARCISDNAQYAINLKDLHKAELALAYMQGVKFGLAMDDKRDKTYLAYMERSMASIRRSKEHGFQLQIDVPPNPSEFLKYDENHCRAMGDMFLHSLYDAPPSNEHIKNLEEEMWKSEGKDPYKLVPDPKDPTGCTLVMADLPKADTKAEDAAIEKKKSPKAIRKQSKINREAMENDSANKKSIISDDLQEAAKAANVKITKLSITFVPGDDDDDGWAINIDIGGDGVTADSKWEFMNKISDTMNNKGYKFHACSLLGNHTSFICDIKTGVSDKIGPATDSAPEVNRLRDLFRTKRISKEAFCGGIATMMAAGIIGKSEFTRLSNLAK